MSQQEELTEIVRGKWEIPVTPSSALETDLQVAVLPRCSENFRGPRATPPSWGKPL
jgi:hypothetical protein